LPRSDYFIRSQSDATSKCKFATGLCLTFGNKADVGPGDKVVQLIKAHSLHTLFAVFEKNRNFILFPLL
jgi:hypothetical protein